MLLWTFLYKSPGDISLEYIPRSGVASPFVCNAKLPSKVFLPVWERGLGLQVLTNTCIRLLVALAQLSSDFSSGFSSSPSSKCIGQAPANMCWALIGWLPTRHLLPRDTVWSREHQGTCTFRQTKYPLAFHRQASLKDFPNHYNGMRKDCIMIPIYRWRN